MDYKKESLENLPDISEEDSLLRRGQLSYQDEQYLDSYNRLIAKGFLSTLTQHEYKIWRMYLTTKLSIKRIAKKLGLSERMIRKYIRQVASKLKEELIIEYDWSLVDDQQYHSNGFKRDIIEGDKYRIRENDFNKTEKLFRERMKKHQKEVDEFIKSHPLVKRRLEEDDDETVC